MLEKRHACNVLQSTKLLMHCRLRSREATPRHGALLIVIIDIDIDGHCTTAPRPLEARRKQQIADIHDPASKPKVADLKIIDDELRETIEANQPRVMNQRGSDLTIFSPRASFMAHHIGDFQVYSTWAAICGGLCFRVGGLFPHRFIPAMVHVSTSCNACQHNAGAHYLKMWRCPARCQAPCSSSR